MSRVVTLVFLLGSACGSVPLRRTMLAPLPPMPLLHNDDGRMLQLGVSRLSRFDAKDTVGADSGLKIPLEQYGVTPMVRVSRRAAVGGSIHGASAQGATSLSEDSARLIDTRPTVGLTAAAHLTMLEAGPFALDGALQLSVDAMPRSELTDRSFSPPTQDVLVIPGVMVSLVPRFTGWWGSAFVSATLHSNADIGAREWGDTGPKSDTIGPGGASRFLLHAGVGYSKTFPFGLGFSIQALLPIAGDPFNVGPMASVSVHWAFIEPQTAPTRPAAPSVEPEVQPDTPML